MSMMTIDHSSDYQAITRRLERELAEARAEASDLRAALRRLVDLVELSADAEAALVARRAGRELGAKG